MRNDIITSARILDALMANDAVLFDVLSPKGAFKGVVLLGVHTDDRFEIDADDEIHTLNFGECVVSLAP